jgi:hypothetical protein
MKLLSSAITSLKRAFCTIHGIAERFDEIKINQGIRFAELNSKKDSRHLRDYEFKVFSQWGEDGIIQRLVSVVDICNKAFIEFGVQDFTESNCRFLLMKDNWDGFVIDGSAANIQSLKSSYYFYKHNLSALAAFITRENINDLLARSGFGEDIGILSIDLDGNDYYILEAITKYRPRILICEYNAVFGSTRKITVPYDASFVRFEKHHTNLYFGASLAALEYLAKQKGYSLVGTNTAGNNAFFVRSDLPNDQIEVQDSEEAFTESKFRESRDTDGNLTFISGNDRQELIKGLPVLNVETNKVEPL